MLSIIHSQNAEAIVVTARIGLLFGLLLLTFLHYNLYNLKSIKPPAILVFLGISK